MQCNVKCFQNCEKECIYEGKFHQFWLRMSFRRCDSMMSPFQSDKCRFLRIWPKLLNLLGPWLWMSIIYYAAQLGEPEQFLVEFFKLTKKRLKKLYRGRYVWRAQHLSQYSISGKYGQVRHPGKQKICAAQLSGWSQDPDLWSIDTRVLHMFCPACCNLNYICKQYHKRRFF